jgi:hypothetical protein
MSRISGNAGINMNESNKTHVSDYNLLPSLALYM